MLCVVFHTVVIFSVAVVVGIPSMWDTATLLTLYQHSGQFNKLTLLLGVMSSQCPCACCVTAPDSASAK